MHRKPTRPNFGESWDTTFELKNTSGTIVWSGISSFKLKLFPPEAASRMVTDNFTVPTSVAAGTYTLSVKIKDPTGYRLPLPLAIQGRQADGSYVLKTVTVQ